MSKRKNSRKAPEQTPPRVFVHEKALVESDQIGEGTRVWAFAHIMAGAVVGKYCNICEHSFIESGAQLGNNVTVKNGVSVWDRITIEDDVFLGPNVVLTNDLNPRAAVKKRTTDLVPTRIRKGATLGANATVLSGITIGEYAFIGAGTVVTRDVNKYEVRVGNPARLIGWMCNCGKRISFDNSIDENEFAICPSCQNRFVRRHALVERTT